MKLTYYQLEKQLTHKLLPVYIVSGDEIVLKQESIDLIRKKASEEGYQERTRLISETGFNWDELYHQLHANSLFTRKRFIELDLTRSLPTKTGSDILKEYSNNAHASDTLLLLNLSKLDAKTLGAKWLSALEKIGALITIWPIPHEQLPQWIVKRAKEYALTLPNTIARTLADYVEGNLIAAAQAIEKLSLLSLKKPIDEQVIASIMMNESRYSIFDFVENCIGGNLNRALAILEQLKIEDTEPTLILWAFTRELRLLAELGEHVKAGHRLEHLLQKQRIFSKRQIAIRHFLSQYTAKDCEELLLRALYIDKIIKGVESGNVWDALQLFCLHFQVKVNLKTGSQHCS